MAVSGDRPREEGYLVLADITGYTSFLTRTELEHAHGIVAELTTLVIAQLAAPLRFIELEGDAVFAYAPGAAFADAERLIDMMEGCYVAFRLRLEEMRLATTCTCTACALMGGLDLKFIAHLGSFVLQQTPTGTKPMGPDVILVHRLLKNRVTETLGTTAYVWLTEAFLERAGGTLGLPAHAEHYDDLGEVRGRVVDLAQAVVRHRDARIFVERSEADLELITPLPVPRAIAWEYHIDPRKRMRWQLDARGIEARPNAAGRAGVGWESHCDHGAYTLVQRAVDWRPFDYLTLDSALVIRGPGHAAANSHHVRVLRGRAHPVCRLHPGAGARPRPARPDEDPAGRGGVPAPVPQSLQDPGARARGGRRGVAGPARDRSDRSVHALPLSRAMIPYARREDG